MRECLSIFLKKNSSAPLYRQLADELMHQMAAGVIQPGARLPTVRGLAMQLHINTSTAVAAYRYLESRGVVYTRQGSGTYAALTSLLNDTAILSDSTLPHELFPSDGLLSAISTLLSSERGDAFSSSQNDLLATACAVTDKLLSPVKIHTEPENIVMTTGTESNISLICRQLLSAGDTVLVPELTSGAIVSAFTAQNANVHSYSVDSDASDIESLIRQYRPALFYLPIFCEVYGRIPAQMSILSDLSGAYSFHTVCDISTLPISYEELKLEYTPGTIFSMSLGRALLPSLPVGFVAFPQPVTDRCYASECDRFIQKSTAVFLETGYTAHINTLRRRFLDKLHLLRERLTSDIFCLPTGGLSAILDLGTPAAGASFCNGLLQKRIIVKPLGALLQKQNGLCGISLACATESDIEVIIAEAKKDLER